MPDYALVVLLATYTLAIFLGSALLFLVQPMIAKMILPSFGGAPSVWNTCLVFFQAALLAGYAYAHYATRWLGTRVQSVLHLAILLMAAAFVIRVPENYDPALTGLAPPIALLGLLCVVVGVPFVALSAGAPVIQRWFGSTRHHHAADPYFLYAASNLGSLVALLGYPLIIEPTFTLREQSQLWSLGFFGLVGLMVVSAAMMWTSKEAAPLSGENASLPKISPSQKLGWIALAAVPSSLLIGVTSFLTANIAAVPLLWIIPLSLYLLTFVIAFSRKQRLPSKVVGWLMGLLAVGMALVVSLGLTDPILIIALVHLAFFTAAALFCHLRLAESRPAAGELTQFYLFLSIGGVLGGAFSALLAPILFSNLAEYPIAIAAALLFRAKSPAEKKLDWKDVVFALSIAGVAFGSFQAARHFDVPAGPLRNAVMLGIPIIAAFLSFHRPVRYALSIGAILFVSLALNTWIQARVVAEYRSFFGVSRIVEYAGGIRSFVHGNTLHGRQNMTPGKTNVPLTYYHPTGPMGSVFEVLRSTAVSRNVALVGLGVGSLAAYGRKGDHFVFLEIDPLVIELSGPNGKWFTFVEESEAGIRIVLGDARLTLGREPSKSFDLIVLDAFSSDAIPVHLLTIEAVQLYLSKLLDGGIIAVHISNRYLDLRDPVARIARELRLSARVFDDGSTPLDLEAEGKTQSTWVVLSTSAEAMAPFADNPKWEELVEERQGRVWTDDYSNVIEAFRR